ncbi:hypothetical protein B8V81_2944 [Paenibacillus pasadenensis]|uniref:Uncharacterized protein n=1 Tax=Paenibacillus pasadenensis TaxID=217090 RepID=A0A2N5N2G3_9BACL|nr:hypothetical protein B8V81_2944 [Paenibacillus pasadenensis]
MKRRGDEPALVPWPAKGLGPETEAGGDGDGMEAGQKT